MCLIASMLMTSSLIAGNNGAIIEEWSQCVKSMGVSSRESWAYRLTDGTSSYWQSCGTQGKHWIRLEMNPDVLIHSLRVQVLLHIELSKIFSCRASARGSSRNRFCSLLRVV